MARFNYDVNTRTRLIDVHKQFNGGLKTVDTDDALGSVFLRQAENVSLSEFGFIEKRYGTIEKEIIQQTTGTLQGYWEYMGFSIFVVNGVFYYRNAAGTVTTITKIYKESEDPLAPSTIFGKEWRYPSGLFTANSATEITGCQFVTNGAATTHNSVPSGNLTAGVDSRPACVINSGTTFTECTLTSDEGVVPTVYSCQPYIQQNITSTVPYFESSFPQIDGVYRDINAVNISNVLYIFTGKYPIYVKLVNEPVSGNNLPRFYALPIEIPTYDEIVVTGHNLLEQNYDQIYYKGRADIIYSTPGDKTTVAYTAATSGMTDAPFLLPQRDSDDREIKRFAPQIPFQDGGVIDFDFKYHINPVYTSAYNSSSQPRFFKLELESVGYRSSGPGAVDFVASDNNNVSFTEQHNYSTGNTLSAVFDEPYIGRDVVGLQTQFLSESQFFSPSGQELFVGVQKGTFKGELVFDLNTGKLEADFIAKEDFKPNTKFQYRLRKQTNDANDPTPLFKIPTTKADMVNQLTIATWNQDKDGNTVDDDGNSAHFITKQTLPKIQIIPVGLNDSELKDNQVVINLNEGLTLTATDSNDASVGAYEFTVPTGLVAGPNVKGYHISLRSETVMRYSSPQSGSSSDYRVELTGANLPTAIYKELVKIEPIAAQATGLASNTLPNLTVKLEKLLAGTYDFRLRFKLSKYSLDSTGILSFNDINDGFEYADVFFYDINITAEKLEGLPGETADTLPKLSPIHTCNKVIEHFGKLMVWGSTEMPTAVFYSFPDRPAYFPSSFYLDFTNDTHQPIEAVTPYMNILVVQTASQTFGIRGNSGVIDAPSPYTPFGINGTVGTIAYKSVRPVRNQLFFLSKQGVIALTSLYAVDESYNIKFVDRNIRNIVPQDSKAVGIQFDNQYWLNFPNNSITLRWYIDKKAWVQDKYQGWSDFDGVFKYQIKDGKIEFITYPSTKSGQNQNANIYRIGVDNDIPTDLFEPIKAKFETSFLNQGYPFHHKNYKEAKLDFTLQNEYNLGRVPIFDSNSSSETGSVGTQTGTTLPINLATNTKFLKHHRYRIVFSFATGSTENVNTLTLSIGSLNITPTQRRDADDNLIPEWEFTVSEELVESQAGVIDLKTLPFTFDAATDDISIRDITYDDDLTFSTYVISENQTLNFVNTPGYNQATVDVDLDLTEKGRLGDWTFGESDFGDKVTAVKTIKLSGKGYNSKLYVEDISKSKWTLESMGITYKMKRARSR